MNQGKCSTYNVITEARYDLSLLEKNILYAILSQLKENDPNNKVYVIYMQELQKKLDKVGYEITVNHFIQATQKFLSHLYVFENEFGYVHMNLLNSSSYKESEDVLEVEVSLDIRPYLLSLKRRYTEVQLDMILSLGSKYSKRMYDILSEYKENSILKIKIQELKERLCTIHPDTGVDKYKEWSSFSNGVLEVAKRELTEHTDISFTYKIKKTGPKFTDLEFHITSNPIPLKD